MEIDGCEVEVRSVEVEGTPLVLVVQWNDQTLLGLYMSHEEAMSLGGLLIGHATDTRSADARVLNEEGPR